MRLTEAHRDLLRTRGVYATEACDKCGQILGPVRYSRYGEKGEWCSRLCRDGVEHKAGACRGCETSLNGRRKGAIYCGRTCRMRTVRKQSRDSEFIVNTPIDKSGLTDAILPYGYEGSREVAARA